MADLDRAIAAAREALKVKSHPLDSRVTKALRDLLAALDAARGEARQKVKDTLTDYLDHYPHPEFLDAVMAHFAPPAALAAPAPSVEDAQRMGEQGGPAVESERLAFEAWMRGHCWALGAVWNGKGYIGMNEEDGFVCPQATRTRGLWAAWRDRAALAQQPAGRLLPPVRPRRADP